MTLHPYSQPRMTGVTPRAVTARGPQMRICTKGRSNRRCGVELQMHREDRRSGSLGIVVSS
jgi:hypothetical protein